MIPQKFYKAGRHPSASTVGQLKALLAELPDDLAVRCSWGKPAELVVFKHGSDDMHLGLCESDDE